MAARSGSIATLGWAMAILVGLNAWVGHRLDVLTRESRIWPVVELDARVGRVRDPGRVAVLVFGNSHALHALRPPSLGPALGLEADAAFNLALPGASAFETALLVRRYAGRFPAARRAFVAVDEALVAADPWHFAARVKYHTRFDPVARWRFASTLPDLERRVAAVGWLPWPIGDFAPELRAVHEAAPLATARRLAGEDGGWAPRSTNGEAAGRAYAWGFPPEPDRRWTTPAARKRLRRYRSDAWLAARAEFFLGGVAGAARAFDDLEAACRALEARGLAVELVAVPYMPVLEAHLARARAADQARYDAALGAYLAASRRRLLAPAIAATDDAFFDPDHMSSEGARRYARALAALLGPGGAGR